MFELNQLELIDIANIIHDMNPSMSCGIDGLTSRILKTAGPSVYPVILYLVNQSIMKSTFPSSWKVGCITPLFKEGDRTDPSNYRPISILPTMGKLIERVVHTKLYSYCSEHDIFSDCQSGFRKGNSTSTCLVDFLSNIVEEINLDRCCGVLFLDLQKAFDMVNHAILLAKLEIYGVRYSARKWIESYLAGRTQVTKVGGEISPPASVTCSVPQGSILGPLLLSLYINDLPLISNAVKWNLYADDTAITASCKSKEEMSECLLNVMNDVSKWFEYNRLSLNLKKTQFLIFGTQPKCNMFKDLELKVNNETIVQSNSVKYLGIKLDSQLTYGSHVEYVRSKTVGKIKLLGRIAPIIKRHTALYLYKSLILPIFDYCSFIIDGMSQQSCQTLQKLQNLACQNILRVDTKSRTRDLHTELGLDYLAVRRKQQMACEMFKISQSMVPCKVIQHFKPSHEAHARSTRLTSSNNYCLPNFKLEMCRRQFVYKGPSIWREVPTELKGAGNIRTFRSGIRALWTIDGDPGIT